MASTEVELVRLDSIPPDEGDFYPCEDSGPAPRAVPRAPHVLATWLDEAFKKWGVRYKVIEGWENRGRPTTSGGFNPNGLLIHHTGTKSSTASPSPSLNTVIQGRSDLTGPLCQVSTDYNGLTYIVAAGRANHAGTARAAMGNPSGDGNAMYLGNEVQTSGLQQMPQAQYDAIVLSSAAILDHFGYRDASKLGLHHTTSTSGKWDLGEGTGDIEPYSITKLRADVTARLKAGPPGGTSGGSTVASRTYSGSTQAAKDTVHAFLSSDAFDAPDGSTTNPYWSGASWTKFVGRWARSTYLTVGEIKATLAGVVTDVKAIRALLEAQKPQEPTS